MPESPKPQSKSFRELIEALPAPIAIVDPAKWDEYLVFREIFISTELNDEKAAAVRAFGKVLYDIGSGGTWRASTSDAKALDLAAAVADLRCLEGYLEWIGEMGQRSVETSRGERWSRSATRFAKMVAALADEIEREVEVGYQQEDI